MWETWVRSLGWEDPLEKGKATYNSSILAWRIPWTILEKAMASHSSTLAWKIPWTEKPGKLQSMGSRRVGRDWATSLSLFIFMHWRRKWQPTPVFLPGESRGRRSLVLPSMGSHRVGHDWSNLAVAAAYCPWGCKVSDMTLTSLNPILDSHIYIF